MRVSPHNHPESPLTGSNLSSQIKRAKELGRTHFAHTDNGHVSSVLKAYSLCKPDLKNKNPLLRNGLQLIPGVEVYFKDSSCDLVSATEADRCRYFSLSIYCKDQEAYQELVKVVSSTDLSTTEIRGEKQQLWNWALLEHMSKFNVEIVISGVHCIVGKVMLAGRADVAEKVFVRLKSIFGDKLSVALLCEPWVKNFSQLVEVQYVDGARDAILASNMVSTDRARRIKALDLVDRSGHTLIKSKSVGTMHYEVNKGIESVKLHKGFLPLPGGDASLRINLFLKALAARHGVNVLVTDYAYYAQKEDKMVQAMRLEGNDKLHPNLHMKTREEFLEYLTSTMRMSTGDAEQLLRNNDAWALKFNGFKLNYEWHLAKVDGDPIRLAMDIIKKNGRMKWDDPKYVGRLREELEVIAKNPRKDLTAYFLPIRDVLDFYKNNGQLTGPGRGSAGGSLFCYLLGITQINPFDYDLPFQRFFSTDRIMMGELPDIDVDLEDRELLVGSDGKSGYLYGRWGDKAAQISTRTNIRLKSAIKDTNRYFKGKVEESIETFTKGLPAPPQGVSDRDFVFGFEDSDGNHIPGLIEQSEELKKYVKDRPEEWEIVLKAMGITKAFSSHASAFVLSDEPIKNSVPTKEGNLTQYEAKECEFAGLIKYDFLVVKQLRDIRVCLDLINKKNNENNEVGNFTHNGKNTYIWDLPKDLDVFKSVWEGSTETCFQINTRSMVPSVKEIRPSSVMDLATILALERPGPRDFVDEKTGRNMVEEYTMRRNGQSKPDIEVLGELLPETYGVICYQEQLNKIARDLAGFPGPEAEKLRKNMSKKKMTELMKMKTSFVEGASKKVPHDIAENIWEQMITFGRYGFSVIHACFTEDQLVKTEDGIKTIKEAYSSGNKIAYLKDDEIFYEKPSAWMDQGEKEVFEIEMEDGSTIKCTKDHKFLDKNGAWVTAKECMERGFFYKKEVSKFSQNKIKSFKSIGLHPVVDIEMPSEHNFILSNGVIAHNCEYAHVTYACMFLKHYYPLEWWASVLTNATEQEITGKLWPYVENFVSPPDINLSGDTMVVDYANEKIRAKLGIIRGMGDATLAPLVENRPYKDIQDFVDKGVAGPSLSHKLIHVGVLDSLFKPKSPLSEKLKTYEDAVEIKKFREKKEKADKAGKKMRQLQPKPGVVPEGYIDLHPLVDAAMKKAVLPSMPISTYELGKKYSKVLAPYVNVPRVISSRGHETVLLNGEALRKLDEIPGENIEKDIYVASTCYVVRTEEFSFPKKNPTKRALKLILDCDGYVSEKVLWPDYETGQLNYPMGLKKGCISTVFFRKKVNRKDMSIQSVVVES